MLERNNGRAPRRAATLLAHFLFIVIIFVLPELVMMVAMPNRRIVAFYPGFYIKTRYTSWRFISTITYW